jgi:hypothetical protein
MRAEILEILIHRTGRVADEDEIDWSSRASVIELERCLAHIENAIGVAVPVGKLARVVHSVSVAVVAG